MHPPARQISRRTFLGYIPATILPLIIPSARAHAAEETPAPAAGLPASGAPPRPTPVTTTIDLKQFREIVESRCNLVLDARPEVFHRLGHVPGALALPRDEFEKYFERLRPQLEAHQHETLVIYCHNAQCEDANLAAAKLAAKGFPRIAIFTGGWEEWSRANLSTERQ